MAMTLQGLLAGWPDLVDHGDPGLPLTAVVEDSWSLEPGALFVAVAGHGSDGHAFISNAVAAGAVAVVVDAAQIQRRPGCPSSDTGPSTWVTAPRTRGLPARLARECEGRPDENLSLVGVTGTNGKTTTAFLLQEMLGRLRGPCGLLGTIRYDDGRRSVPAPLTTPGGPVLYHWLARMSAEGCRSAAMEVSSHGLDQGRTDGLALDAAVLTDLGRDDLDYHGDMDRYLAAKCLILELLAGPRRAKPTGVAVVNVADAALTGVRNPHGETVGYSTDPTATLADLRLRQADLSLEGSRLALTWRATICSSPVPRWADSTWRTSPAALDAALALGYDPDRLPRRPGGGAPGAGPHGAFPLAHRRPGRGGLRPYPRRPGRCAPDLPGTVPRRVVGGVRLRRRPRSRQAPAHGRGGRPPGRPRLDHLRQSAHRGPAGRSAPRSRFPGRCRDPAVSRWSTAHEPFGAALAAATPGDAW